MAAGIPPDLRKRIEIMAEHISRNGPDFELTVKSKNVSNPQFAFLYNGEGSEYYRQVLGSHRSGGGGGASSAGPSQAAAGNGSAAPSVAALQELLQRWREPGTPPVAPEVERQIGELLASLESMASRDAIRNGRMWIEANVGIGQQIAGQMMKRIVFIPTCSHRLHVLYLVHDVLQTEAARKEPGKPLIRAFKPYLVWLLRPAYQLARKSSTSGDESQRVLRLLQLWVERSILTQQESDEVRTLIVANELPNSGGPPRHLQAQMPRPSTPRVMTPRPGMPGMVSHGAWPTMGMPQRPYGVPMNGMPGAAMYMGHQRPPTGCGGFGGYGGCGGYLGGCGGCGQMTAKVYGGGRYAMGPGPQTPESIPVGVMATMLKNVLLRGKNMHQEFVRYKPLDPTHTPQMLPPMDMPTQRVVQRVEDFYEDLRDLERSSSSSRSSSRSKSRSRSRSTGKRPAGLGGFNAHPPPLMT